MIRKYFKDASLLAGTELLVQLKGLLVIPFLTARFGAINYGAWSQIAVILATIVPLVILGTDSAAIRLMPGLESDKQKRFFSAWLLFMTVMACLFAAALLLLRFQFTSVFLGEATGEYLSLVPLASLWLITTAMDNALQNWFRIKNNARLLSISTLLGALLNVVAIAAMLIRNESVYELILYTLLGEIILICILAFVITRAYGWLSPDFALVIPMLRYGLPLVPGGFAIWGLNYMDRLFLLHYSSLKEVGIYAVAYSAAYRIIPIFFKPWRVMFSNSASELFDRGNNQVLQRLFDRSAGLSFALSVPASIGIFVLGSPLLKILATDEFLSGQPVLFFVSSGYIFLALQSYYATALGLIHKQVISTWINFVALFANIALNLLLVPSFSITGAAVATSLSFLICLVLSYYFTSKLNILKTNMVFPLKIIIASIFMGLAVFLVQAYVSNQFSNLVIQIAILAAFGCVVYAGLLWVFGILNKRELLLALSLVQAKSR